MDIRKPRRKAFLLLAMLLGSGVVSAQVVIKGNVYGGCVKGVVTQSTSVTVNNDTVKGSVYGGCLGDTLDATGGVVKGNTWVYMKGGTVVRSIYGGGQLGSVGTFTYGTVTYPADDPNNPNVEVQVPTACASGTGVAHVLISGGQVGVKNLALMPHTNNPGDDELGYVFCGSQGLADSINYPQAIGHGVTDSTYLEISGGLITASAYGGSENGLVLRNTRVEIQGGQIGVGHYVDNSGHHHFDNQYTDSEWNTVITKVRAGTLTNADIANFHTCDAWPYEAPYAVYDIFADETGYDAQGGSTQGSNGHSFFGNVFGGGSGYYPFAPGIWRHNAGRVYGNTTINISGGHILTCVYGGNEITDVVGKCTINMSGGTVGVPLSIDSIQAHPVMNYILGAGMGDARPMFDTWTDVGTTEVNITGGTVFGSVFGGGEDGHVLGDATVNINEKHGNATIGTWGCSYYDGNVFGGGRGYQGDAIPEGAVSGNTYVNIEKGLILGSVYGGGRLASVGIFIVDETNTQYYGAMQPGDGHGITTVNITGGTIGNKYEPLASQQGYDTKGGNVFGGSMGRLTNLDGSINHLWDSLAYVKKTIVNISQESSSVPTLIKGNVYGGCEFGKVHDSTSVNISGGRIGIIAYQKKSGSTDFDTIVHVTGGMVFGGGKGYKDNDCREAGIVLGNTHVTLSGGHVYYNVYGGGELGSVGQRASYTYTINGASTTFTDYKPVAGTGLATVTVKGGQVGPAPRVETGYNIPIGLNGVDGYVFGGGKGVSEDWINPAVGLYSGSYPDLADVNNTRVTVKMPMPTMPANNAIDTTNRIWGSTFGGGEDGHVLGNAHTDFINGLMGTKGTTTYDGNIFGGGRNYNKANYNAGRVRCNDSVHMCGGQIYGSIFGGGRLALTGVDVYGNILPDNAEGQGAKYGYTHVKINGGTVGNDTDVQVTLADNTNVTMPFVETWTKSSMGDVYGGGKGDMVGIKNHPVASALLVSLVKNTEVIITDSVSGGNIVSSPKILSDVFGGGEVGNVGLFTWTISGGNIGDIALVPGTGKAKVTVSGGQIGIDRMHMIPEVVGGNGSDKYDLKYNCDIGHVFGGGEGLVDNPNNYSTINPPISGSGDVHSNKSLLDLMATVGETDVTIGSNTKGSAWVKGSVYGGSLSGHVLGDTKVTVSGGQVGAGKGATEDKRYTTGTTAGTLFNPLTTSDAFETSTGDVKSTYALAECEAWPYNKATNYPFSADSILLKGITPTDGKTWFGNVFGGGSGYYPYHIRNHANNGDTAVWNRESGKVYGNATVVITGGHILTSVYGGCETSDVGHFTYNATNGGTFVGVGDGHTGGIVSVTMKGGTLGVPRTFNQIKNHPVTCYLFGGGKGDPRVEFNSWTNVKQATDTVQDCIIYGSVFGGGEDGHVFYDTYVNIREVDATTVIGTTGRSYVDGNVFGGGRGFSGEALTAGVVRGNATMNITGGTMLGSIYGGGRLASVGTNLVPTTNTNYSKMMADGTDGNHGHITINIGNGNGNGSLTQTGDVTIGNDWESITHINFDTISVGGNIYSGGMGRIMQLNDTDINPQWHLSGRVKNTTLNIGQATGKKTTIKGNVYGGGALGTVGGEVTQTTEDHSTHVNIYGGTIWRDVYGGGYGSDETGKKVLYNGAQVSPMQLAARVFGNSTVTVNGGWIKKSIYGGGEMASVGRVADSVRHVQTDDPNSTKDVVHPFYLSWPMDIQYATGFTEGTGKATVNINGGRVGVAGKDYLGPWNLDGEPIYYDNNGVAHEYRLNDNSNDPGGVKDLKKARKDNGDIYGGGKGKAGSTYIVAHLANVRETEININENTTATPLTYKPYNPYAGVSGISSKINYIIDLLPNLEDFTYGEVDYGTLGCISGAVYGGSEDGHVRDNTHITLDAGLVGHAMYGGGKGKGTYTLQTGTDPNTGDPITVDTTNIISGKTFGNTRIDINGGYVVRNVFGGGNLASIGKGNYLGFGETTDDANIIALATGSGKATVNINGGTLGMLYPDKPSDVFKDNVPYGSVFGGARGAAHKSTDLTKHRYSFVNETEVTIGETEGNNTDPHIHGSVYGGGQDGHVRRSTKVVVNDGEIGVAYGSPSSAHTNMGVPAASLTPTQHKDGDIGLDDYNWTERGNVFGGGSGLSTIYEDTIYGTPGFYNPEYHALYAGSVFATTEVEINGGKIHRDVFGGGNLAQVLGYGNTTNTQTVGVNDKVKVTVQSKAQVGVQSDVDGSYHAAGVVASDSVYRFVYGGNVFGAGRGFASNDFEQYCNVFNTDVTVTSINDNCGVYGDVFGGGENGHVLKDTDVKILDGAKIGVTDNNNGGTTTFDGNVFGGGWGSGAVTVVDDNDTPSNPDDDIEEYRIFQHCGRVGGNTNITMEGGTIQGSIFGGGRLAMVGVKENGDPYVNGTVYDSLVGNIHGLATINVSGGSIGNSNGDKLLNGSDESVGDIFGSGKGDVKNYQDVLAGRVANTIITVSGSPRIYGAVFGGGEMAGIGYWHEVSGKQVFYENSGTSVVTIGGSPEIGTDYEYTTEYAGTDPEWTVYDEDDGTLIHTCTGNVFGGSQGDVDPECPHWVSMGRSRRTFVTINGGTIKSSVFGGAEQGAVTDSTKVVINGGTIGTSVTPASGPAYWFGGVYGGGYGSHREDYNTDPADNDSTLALGTPMSRPNILAGRVYGNTKVKVLGGTIQGDVYGGASYAYIGGHPSRSGDIKGNTKVYIGKESQIGHNDQGGTFKGSVYGANNHAGTPYGNVDVHIISTAHNATNVYPSIPDNLTSAVDTLNWLASQPAGVENFAIYQVFGGSNEADYTPVSGKRAWVKVYECRENTVYDVYGGSNAADVGVSGGTTNTNLIIDGGRIYRVFGGGNGEVRAADIYGTATTTVNGGLINQVFGGSNTNGHIDNINLTINEDNDCGVYIQDVFGGGNSALIVGDVTSTVQCCDAIYSNYYGGNSLADIYGNVTVNIYGAEYNNVFGGSKGDSDHAANIKKFPASDYDWANNSTLENYPDAVKDYLIATSPDDNPNTSPLCGTGGNVTLNLFGGTIHEAAFGGSDVNGNIEGQIRVNVINLEEECNLYLNNLYGAGRTTAYTPSDPTLNSPEINFVNGTAEGSVFGGGQGFTAITTANPVVNMGYDAVFASDSLNYILNKLSTADDFSVDTAEAIVKGNIFGGGNLAQVQGDTKVNIARANTVVGNNGKSGDDGNVFGGGRGDAGNYIAGRVSGNTTVEMRDGTILGNIYGGGCLGMTGTNASGEMQSGTDHGNTKVMVKGGTVGNKDEIETFTDYSMGNIYGGGKGYMEDNSVANPVPAASALRFGLAKNTTVEISNDLGKNTHIYGIVLGGGELANVGSYTITEDPNTHAITGINVTDGLSKVRISGGIIGGDQTRMRPDHYGPWLNYNDDLGYVYGGGEGWSDDPDNYEMVQDTSLLDLIATVQNTEVEISGTAWVKASVFGGSESGHVKKDTKVTIKGGQIGAGYYVINGVVRDSLYDPNQFVNPLTTTITSGTGGNSLEGTAHWVYGADDGHGNTVYNPFDPVLLNQNIEPSDGKSWFGNVFGGGSGWFPAVTGDGSEHPYESHWYRNSGKVWGNTEVNIEGGHILNNVYGANESTDVGGKATIKMKGGTVGVPRTEQQYKDRPLLGYVYGGGAGDPRPVFDNLTNVASTDVQITGGIVYGSVMGGSEDGHILGDAKVTVNETDGTTVIGCSGKSGFDGNIFGGGRNFFGDNKAAGRVTGKTTIDMSDGVALGNVYGGGRAGSVDKSTHVNISGGYVGTEQIGVPQVSIVNGSVYGGGLGKAGGKNQGNAHEFANVDSTYVNISGDAMIYNSVFGGGDNGHVMKSTVINMTGGTVGQKNTLAEFVTDSLDHTASHIYTGSVIGGGRGVAAVSPGVYNDTTGIVFGNTNVTVSGGTVRHGVYGGGGLSHVGTFVEKSDDTIQFASGTGITKVTVNGNAHIGPTKDDLTLDNNGNPLPPADIDNHFKYIGGNAGWVFGSGCGLPGQPDLTFNDSTFVTIGGTAQVIGAVFGGGENGHVARNTRVDITGGTIGAFPLHDGGTVNITEGVYSGVTFTADKAETYENKYGGGHRVFRGDVYGGGKGTDTIGVNAVLVYSHTAGRVYGSTTVNVSGGTIYQRVYGGGSMASVGKYTYHKNSIPNDIPLKEKIQRISYVPGTGITNVNISGGAIGTNGLNNGDVVGGGRGVVGNPHGYDVIISGVDGADQVARLAYVGSTNVNIETGANVRSNVYGGSINGHVFGDTHVTMDGGTVGYTYQDGDTTKVHGGWHSNVYGGGGGSGRFNKGNKPHLSITSGRVFGNTNVTINGGQVYHNVYGGGAIASVGTYDLRANQEPEVAGTGSATVTITGGTIGLDSYNPSSTSAINGFYDGNNNGMVYGSGRGDIDSIGAYLDSLSFVIRSYVTIGKDKNAGPLVKGSVYGSGENGHVYKQANVTVKSGTIGCSSAEFATYSADSTKYANQLEHFHFRGNVYGAGCGTDKFTDKQGKKRYNPQSGIVWGDANVTIDSGYVSRHVYGGGAMASVGYFTSTPRHKPKPSEPYDPKDGDTLSWPCEFTYLLESSYPTSGTSNVYIYGGHIGTYALRNDPTASGCVFGSSRGEAGDRYEFVPLANVRNANVTVDFAATGTSFNNTTEDVIIGSVYGSGESGHVYDDTQVHIVDGLVAGSVFGGGEGKATYEDVLLNPTGGSPLPAEQVHSITAGKVFGNTHVTIDDGYVLHNVYGGGNMASVGKSNYLGYGEDGDNANLQASGKAYVTINGGQIGTTGIENGHVFGSSRGLTFPDIKATPRYYYSRDFFLGYTNETYVTIGENVVAAPTNDSPRIFGSVFGGGQDGHVRLNTDVIVQDAEIGVEYDPDDGNIDDDKWVYRGNVYGAGRGIDYIPGTTTYCPSAGSVTLNTNVTVKGGLIHRSVYGGGSLATVGPPPTGYDPGSSLTTVSILGGTIGDATGVANMYGGDVYGSARGLPCTPNHPQLNTMASVKEAVVNIGKEEGGSLSGSGLVHGSVFGSGENGHVNANATVNIYQGSVGDNTSSASEGNEYCGNVFGAGSGTEKYGNGDYDYNPVAGIVKGNTEINMKGGWVMRSIYGGGEMAAVGTITDSIRHIKEGQEYPNIHDTDSVKIHPFYLSWPYEFTYQANTGKATINVTGGRIGITGKDGTPKKLDNGDIYGGSKGLTESNDVGSPYQVAHLSNVNETEININYTNFESSGIDPTNYKVSPTAEKGCITGAVYGGGENGHVNTNTHITLTKGLVGHAIYGGGKGKGKYGGKHSRTAGKVFGNTRIDINAADTTHAYVVRSVFGGGNLASVGKGNYAGYFEGDNSSNWNDTLHSGNTFVTVTGGTLGMLPVGTMTADDVFKDTIPYGSVFGGCRGEVTAYVLDTFGYVNRAHVVIGDASALAAAGPRLYGSVYGGAQDGHVRWDTDVAVHKGKIGAIPGTDNVGNNNYTTLYWTRRGNVLGGGAGLNVYKDGSGNKVHNPNAGSVSGNTKVVVDGGTILRDVYGGGNLAAVGKFHKNDPHPETDEGHTRVFIEGGTIGHATGVANDYGGNVFAGGNQGYVQQERVVTVSGGLVKNNVYGGSNTGIPDVDTTFLSLKTVNVRGGHIEGSVFGCSHGAKEGDPDHVKAYTGFINISGGTIDKDVYAGGSDLGIINESEVKGSLCVNIGATAILSTISLTENKNTFYNVKKDGTSFTPAPAKLLIGRNVYGGALHDDNGNHFEDYHVTGFSSIFIDGTNYNMDADTTNKTYMYLNGGIYGCGSHCESGEEGRKVFVRNYGARNSGDEFTASTRTLTTIQRCDTLLLDHVNINLSGVKNISQPATNDTLYGVVKVDRGLYVTNGSGIVLKDNVSGTDHYPAFMDSIKQVKSLWLISGTSYENMNFDNSANWEWIGIQNNDNKLYRISSANAAIQLTAAQENVIIFNDTARLLVRYSEGSTTKYGELKGFFRMRGDSYDPKDSESFAYARPKITDGSVNNDDGNTSDGGFLSYHYPYNYFTDNGTNFTKTKQYPYVNIMGMTTKSDREEWRIWAYPRQGNLWYVDGTRGLGQDVLKSVDIQAGRYPDKAKKTLFGKVNGAGSGVISEQYATDKYSYKKDLIYVVGALSAQDELDILHDSVGAKRVPLRLYRYPGGHEMSNGEVDEGTGSTIPTWGNPSGTAGPGPNYGALLNVQATKSATLKGVVMDGLYDCTQEEQNDHMIPASFDTAQIMQPLIITHASSTLTLCDSTVLMRGYNHQNAYDWYTNPDYKSYTSSGPVYNGAAIFVDSLATVYVEDTVVITGNKQRMKIGDAPATLVESNVYLPTFATHLNIKDELHATLTRIGITSPRRNRESDYKYNTFSPVAVATRTGHEAEDASAAYTNNNFLDDMDMFFVNDYTVSNDRSTYYATSIPDYPGFIEESHTTAIDMTKTLFFGWTWANVVRTAPGSYDVTNLDSEEDLAWFISTVNGLNGQTATASPTASLKADVDMKQYVWVPVGAEEGDKPFTGSFDGRGHIIENLSIDYIGQGDRRYEYTNYGLFGWAKNATIERTFVVSGINRPVGGTNLGGLAGFLQANGGTATLSNSEAAVQIVVSSELASANTWYAGGLVGKADAATIHSSMAMPDMECTGLNGYVGGLLGGSEATNGRPSVENSFANAKFTLGNPNELTAAVAGGLVGYCANMDMKNCYIHLYDKGNLYDDSGVPTSKKFGQMVGDGSSSGTASSVTHCYGYGYGQTHYSPDYQHNGISISQCNAYSAVASSDTYRYMYYDNHILSNDNGTPIDTALFIRLNINIREQLGDNVKYARWTRPTLPHLNGDLPVLMLCNYENDDKNKIGLGKFRSMGTYAGGPALQYGGPVRDDDQLNTALGRAKADNSKYDYLFIYGDSDATEAITATIAVDSVAIYEHAAILAPGTLANFDKTFVGVTFDNTSRNATDAYGNRLYRDWHMFSTPLANAPLGMNYYNSTEDEDENLDGVWVEDGSLSNKYVYKPTVWNYAVLDDLPRYPFTVANTSDGYFPSQTPSTYTNPSGDGYPYQYDFYTWYEPDWQWINFKRNGPSHWHYDEDPQGPTYEHHHINYKATTSATPNQNETTFVLGKGYMMAIHDDTYVQSHGRLNKDNVPFVLTNSTGTQDWSWVPGAYGYYGNNFVGNPYHAYLDFNAFGIENGFNSYYMYDADSAASGTKSIDYLIYPYGGSENGYYAPQYLHPHQGFFLQTLDATKEITFKSSHIVNRSDAKCSPFRDWRPSYPLVNLFAYDSEGRGDVVVIEFNRPENGGGKKVKSLRSGNHLIYAHNGDTDYGAFFAEEGTSRVPVRFWSFESQQKPYTLRWETHNGFFHSLYLIDNLLGITYDMLENDSYTFVGSKEDYLSRFVIVFNVTDVEENTDPKTFAFYDGSTWVVNGTGRLEVVDVTGRILYTEDLHNEQNHINLNHYAKGVYMLRLWKHDKASIQKIVTY